MRIRMILYPLILFAINSNAQNVFFNEIRADDAGTDDGEFIELVGPAGTDISGWQIEHINGTGGSSIFSFIFPQSTVIPDDGVQDISGQPIGFFVIKRTSHNVENYDLEWGTPSLQNGPDGLILQNDQGERIQALTWNGTGDLSGGEPPWRNIGNDQNTDNSLSAPDSVFESYHKQWQYVSPTPGAINSNQSIGDISLPVELSSFRAISGDSHVRIVWITEAELDNLGFIIERSDKNDGNYLQIASYESMESLQGAGNSSENRHYSVIDYSVFNGLTYWYRLIDVSTNGIYTVHAPVSATPQAPPEPVAPVPEINYPEHFSLAQNYPNPFNPKTKIGFFIAKKGKDIPFVNLSIFDMTGKKVRTLHNGFLMPNSYEIEWNGLNERGEQVAGGVYIYVLSTQGFIQSRKMLLLR